MANLTLQEQLAAVCGRHIPDDDKSTSLDIKMRARFSCGSIHVIHDDYTTREGIRGKRNDEGDNRVHPRFLFHSIDVSKPILECFDVHHSKSEWHTKQSSQIFPIGRDELECPGRLRPMERYVGTNTVTAVLLCAIRIGTGDGEIWESFDEWKWKSDKRKNECIRWANENLAPGNRITAMRKRLQESFA